MPLSCPLRTSAPPDERRAPQRSCYMSQGRERRLAALYCLNHSAPRRGCEGISPSVSVTFVDWLASPPPLHKCTYVQMARQALPGRAAGDMP